MGTLTGSFGATGNSGTNYIEGDFADLVVGGTFVGTIQLQCGIPGAAGATIWVSVGQLTAAGVVSFNAGGQRQFRVACTAYTSGTAYYSASSNIDTQLVF